MAQNTYSLIISYNCGGQFAQNVTHWQFDDAGYATTKTAAEALQAAWVSAGRNNSLRSILSAAVSIVSLRGACVSTPGGFDAFTPISSSNVGQRGAAMSASGLAPVLVSYPINLSLARGRFFVPGVAELDIEDGIFTTAFRAAVLSALANLFDNLTLAGGGAPTAVFGYFRRPQKVFVALPNTILSENLGTMKRRMRPA